MELLSSAFLYGNELFPVCIQRRYLVLKAPPIQRGALLMEYSSQPRRQSLIRNFSVIFFLLLILASFTNLSAYTQDERFIEIWSMKILNIVLKIGILCHVIFKYVFFLCALN